MASITTTASNSGTGLGSGIDVQAMVTATLSGDQAIITRLQSRQALLNTQTAALALITSDLTNLRASATALKDPLGALNALKAASSNTAVLTASAATSAVAAVHNITVNALATTSSYYTNPVASSTTVLGTGSFAIQVGGQSPATTVTLDATNNTLDGLAAAINNQTSAVRASVITDANGARLAIVSTATGKPGDIVISPAAGDITSPPTIPPSTNTTSLVFNKAVSGTNSSLVIDGIPISTNTNVVGGVINGVTLNLSSALPNTQVTLSITQDTETASSAIGQFVSAYNSAITDINKQFAVGPAGSGGGPLEADGSVREAQSALLASVVFSMAGNNGIVNLSSMGVNLSNDGTMTVDQGKLSNALSTNYSSVLNFVQTPTTGLASTLSKALSNLTDSSAGVLGLDTQGISRSTQDLTQHIADLQAALFVKQQNLIITYSKVNITLQQLPLLQAQLASQLASIR